MALSDYITAAILSKELGVASATATSILKETGGGEKVGNTTFYNREAVRNVLVERNSTLLTFLGYQAPMQAPVASKENADV